MTRILAIIANESVSGPGRQLGALAAAISSPDTAFEIAILHRSGNPPPPYAAYLERLGVSCTLIEDQGPLDRGVLKRVAARIAVFQPSILQSHGYKATAVAWALRRRGLDLPWIGFFHGETHENLKARFYHWLDHRMLVSADRVIVMSGPQQSAFERLGAPVHRIHNALLPDPGSSTADDTAEIESAAADLVHPILGVVGRLSPEKGVDVFLEACSILAAQRQPFSALIAGDGPERGRLEALVDRLGLRQSVRLLGEVSRVSALYRVIDVVVIPSRSEGLPNVLLEGIGAGRPAIATAVGAIPDVLADRRAGLVVPPEDPYALAAAVAPAYALKDSADGRAGRAAAAEAFSLDLRVRRHVEMYSEISTGRARS